MQGDIVHLVVIDDPNIQFEITRLNTAIMLKESQVRLLKIAAKDPKVAKMLKKREKELEKLRKEMVDLKTRS